MWILFLFLEWYLGAKEMKPAQLHETKLCMHISRHLVKYEPTLICSVA
jgi:hypothetical protein